MKCEDPACKITSKTILHLKMGENKWDLTVLEAYGEVSLGTKTASTIHCHFLIDKIYDDFKQYFSNNKTATYNIATCY